MSAVQRTMHPEHSYGPGCRTEVPWAWERLPKRLRLAGYLLAVIAADLSLTGWLLTRAQPETSQLLLFAAFLGCGAACVEATRRWGAPPTGTRDLLTAWWLPAALLLPPVYALTAPVLVGGLTHWRARQGPLYWRAFTAAALGLAGAAASFLFHQVGAHGHWLLHPVTVAEAAGCAGLFVLANAALIAIAARAAHSGVPWRSAAWDSESLLVDLAGLCAGVLVTIACALNWVLLFVALPPIILLQRSLLHQQLRAAARTDAKTGLLNALAWQREADTWIRRARRASLPAAVLLIDIDHFKRVNDTYGHLAGDELLAATASTLVQYVRACDVLGRFGGEEFVAVLPGAGEQEACYIAERLRERVRAISVPARGGLVTVTISIGVAALGRDGAELFELLATADAALYRAKKSGRDRVCTLPPGGCPSDPRH
ncbi:MAG TPA: GGDEF domain-containing protein [Streptosporangiaceae bacterium]|nr:GGDEF domain-containing protein [Streptosporangiaceae bacterium]